MKHTLRAFSILAAVLLLLCAPCAFAQDWPQWRGINRDGKATGFTPPATAPKEPTRKWQVTVGAGDATPALLGNKLYVFARQGDNEVTLCLNAGDGKELWRDTNAVPAITGPAAREHQGPRSSPAVAGSKVATIGVKTDVATRVQALNNAIDSKVVTLGVLGTLSCLDANTGKVLWRKDEFPGVFPQFYTSSSPLITDGMVIAFLGGKGNGALIAYDLTTGTQKWKWAGEAPDYGSPVVATIAGVKQIVTLTEKSLVGVALADGKLLWQVPCPAERMAYNAATPIVDGDMVIYSGRGTKAVKIEKQGNTLAATALWSNAEASVSFNTPVLKDGLLFGMSNKGLFFCLDAKTGKTDWTDTTPHGRGFGAIVDLGQAIIALPASSELIAFKPSSTEYAEVAHFKVADTPTYTYPIFAGKNIYVKDQQMLTMWAIE